MKNSRKYFESRTQVLSTFIYAKVRTAAVAAEGLDLLDREASQGSLEDTANQVQTVDPVKWVESVKRASLVKQVRRENPELTENQGKTEFQAREVCKDKKVRTGWKLKMVKREIKVTVVIPVNMVHLVLREFQVKQVKLASQARRVLLVKMGVQ